MLSLSHHYFQIWPIYLLLHWTCNYHVYSHVVLNSYLFWEVLFRSTVPHVDADVQLPHSYHWLLNLKDSLVFPLLTSSCLFFWHRPDKWIRMKDIFFTTTCKWANQYRLILPVRNEKLQTVSITSDFFVFLSFLHCGAWNPWQKTGLHHYRYQQYSWDFLASSELKFSDSCGLHALCYEVAACILLTFTDLRLNYLVKVTKINSFIVSS